MCRLGTLMRPAAKENICGICHEPVIEQHHGNSRSAPTPSLRSGMVMVGTDARGLSATPIAKAEETISALILDVSRLHYDREIKRGKLMC
jgi:hypothetical protein